MVWSGEDTQEDQEAGQVCMLAAGWGDSADAGGPRAGPVEQTQ